MVSQIGPQETNIVVLFGSGDVGAWVRAHVFRRCSADMPDLQQQMKRLQA